MTAQAGQGWISHIVSTQHTRQYARDGTLTGALRAHDHEDLLVPRVRRQHEPEQFLEREPCPLPVFVARPQLLQKVLPQRWIGGSGSVVVEGEAIDVEEMRIVRQQRALFDFRTPLRHAMRSSVLISCNGSSQNGTFFSRELNTPITSASMIALTLFGVGLKG